MSGPVVAIGYILLVPSILGLVIRVMFRELNASSAGVQRAETSESSLPVQSSFDGSFRKSCASAYRQKNLETGYTASQRQIEQYCECALSQNKETSSELEAAQTCLQRSREGTLEESTQDVDAFYSNPTSHRSSDDAAINIARFIGRKFAISIGIDSFVGGLLGWLLVMRKRVLQCNVCGAVVNAS